MHKNNISCEMSCRWCVANRVVGNMVEWTCLKGDELSEKEFNQFVFDMKVTGCAHFEPIPEED